jgi:biofilm PGA synthesis N-glycosyltransferase PgaC
MPRGNYTAAYIIISPVKDEERHLDTTIHSVLNQTLRPGLWIFVDDGSRDATPAILRRYAAAYDWIRVLTIDRDAARQPGSGVIRAFTLGYRSIGAMAFDFVVKLDCDLELPHDYFEQLLARFQQDEKLGIASGLCMERNKKGWYPSSGPPYHAVGASKIIRTKCFEAIGGFIPSRGWDTVDEIRAQMTGWRTCHVREVEFYHLKPEGSGIGFVHTNTMHGEIHYLTDGGTFFFLLKAAHRMLFGKPFLLGGLAMLYGFLVATVSGKKKLVSRSEGQFYRRLLNRRIWQGVSTLTHGSWMKARPGA